MLYGFITILYLNNKFHMLTIIKSNQSNISLFHHYFLKNIYHPIFLLSVLKMFLRVYIKFLT
jgi:hypothetical protein